jgi:hypothetical protein
MIKSNSAKLKEMVASLNDMIEQTYHLEQTRFKIDNQIKSNKDKIIRAMGRSEKVDVVIDESTAFRATKTTNTNIEFFPDKLKDNLPKDTYKRIVVKNIGISDLNGLIEMLKEYGVSPKKFKEFIFVKESVSVEKVDNLIELGEITIDSIQGCYKVEYEDILKVSKTK